MPFHSFYGENVDTSARPAAVLELDAAALMPVWRTSELTGETAYVVNLDHETTRERAFLRELLEVVGELAPEHGPGVRRSSQTGTLWYSAAWLER